MGEYVVWNQRVVKIGTTESLYYTRYADYRQLVEDGALEQHPGNLQPGKYLEGEFRFRFPFPDEDTDAAIWPINGYENFDRGELVMVSQYWMAGQIEHGQASAVVTAPYGAPLPERLRRRATMRLDCPQSGHETPGLVFEHGGYYHIEIVQQRPYDGALWTVCRCPYCGTLWRIPPDAASELHEYMHAAYQDNEPAWEIADRILAGYTTATEAGSCE